MILQGTSERVPFLYSFNVSRIFLTVSEGFVSKAFASEGFVSEGFVSEGFVSEGGGVSGAFKIFSGGVTFRTCERFIVVEGCSRGLYK